MTRKIAIIGDRFMLPEVFRSEIEKLGHVPDLGRVGRDRHARAVGQPFGNAGRVIEQHPDGDAVAGGEP